MRIFNWQVAAFAAIVTTLGVGVSAQADVFNPGPNRAPLEFLPVGNPGNPANSEGIGSVGYDYQIAKTEIPANAYIEFLNKVGKYTGSLYNSGSMNDSNNDTAQIERTGSATLADPFVYSYKANTRDEDTQARPVSGMNWRQAARFANWLHNGQPDGTGNLNAHTDPAIAGDGAYNMNVAPFDDQRQVNPGAKYWIATEDEWVKAAYYNPGTGTHNLYSTGGNSNIVPSNFPFRTTPANPHGLHDNTDVQNVIQPWFTGTPSSIPDPGNNANYPSNYLPGSAATVSPRAFAAAPNGNQGPLGVDINGPFVTEVGWFENSKSSYGAYDMCGNLWETQPTTKDNTASAAVRGGSFLSGGGNDAGIGGVSCAGTQTVPVNGPSDLRGGRIDLDPFYFGFEDRRQTFRLAAAPVPEPATLTLMGGALGLLLARRRRTA